METKTSSSNLFSQAISLGIKNTWRNSVLSLITIFVIGIIIFIFNIILAINFVAKDALTNLNKKVDLIVYVKDDTSANKTQEIITDIQKLEGVTNVTLTSKEDALKDMAVTHPDIVSTFEKYNLGNPLPASLAISTSEPKYHQTISDFLNQPLYKTYLSNITSNGSSSENAIITSVSKNLIKVNNFTHQVIFWLIITFVIGGSLIIINALQITIFTRKKEISVMKLVGAPFWFIQLPFIVESIMYGIFATMVSFVLLYFVSQNLNIENTNLLSYYTNIKFYKIFLGELIMTITLSIISSLILIHEHLYKKEL